MTSLPTFAAPLVPVGSTAGRAAACYTPWSPPGDSRCAVGILVFECRLSVRKAWLARLLVGTSRLKWLSMIFRQTTQCDSAALSDFLGRMLHLQAGASLVA